MIFQNENSKSLADLRTENKHYLSRLSVCRHQVENLLNQLDEVAEKSTNPEHITTRIRQFRERFDELLDLNDDLRRWINNQENELMKYILVYQGTNSGPLFDESKRLHTEIQQYNAIFTEVKDRFYHFISAWM